MNNNFLIAHWGNNKKHIFDPVVASLEQLGATCIWIRRDDMNVREEFLAAIRSGQF